MATMTDAKTACLEACQQCALDCEACHAAMMSEASDNACPACCYECIKTCNLCVSAIASGSHFLEKYCALCAEACRWCADQCGQHDHDHCQKCAQSCRDCAEACEAMA